MSATVRVSGLACALLVLSTTAVQGFGHRSTGPSYYYQPYTPAAPATWTYPISAPCPAWTPVPNGTRLPNTSSREYAPVSPAPPSPEPIEAPPRSPGVSESRSLHQGSQSTSYYDAFKVAENPVVVNRPEPGVASVAFWNLTGRPLALKINGQTYTLERGRPRTLAVPAAFSWQIDNRNPETTQLADGQRAMEIVIRR